MPNRLAGEPSPYLRQHAGNPVDWYAWSATALALARREDRPILLSIGYSACHWCHVMAHESFDDAATAAVMNRHFVNIKVDREERPDLDQIYQLAHQALMQRPGGWPLTAFLTPDGRPFYVGTYFPPRARHGLPAFVDLLGRIADAWRERRGEIEGHAAAVANALDRYSAPASTEDGDVDEALLDKALAEMRRSFDEVNGGFGAAPKFPRPGDLAWLLGCHYRRCEPVALDMATTTLRRMAEGGIYDQLGGGFFRYSVDAEWAIPHFEKMLCDNAQLLSLYVDAWRVSREPSFARVVTESVAWAEREMLTAEGVFASSLDADSEGEEGRAYIWHRDAARALLDDAEWQVAARHFGLDRRPNFVGECWHLGIVEPIDQVASALGLTIANVTDVLASARRKLFAARCRRVPPARDDKCLTAWNALMVRALSRAAATFARPDWLALARRAFDFMRREHWRQGRLLASSRHGHAYLNAYLDDHAFLLDAVIELQQVDYREADTMFARVLADCLCAHFVEPASGAFLMTSDDHEALIHRPFSVHDGALPAGSAVAVSALLRLSCLTGCGDYERVAWRALRVHLAQVGDWAAGAATLLGALNDALAGIRLIVVRGVAAETADWQRQLAERYLPDTLVLVGAAGQPAIPVTAGAGPRQGVVAMVCERGVCRAPETDLDALMAGLSKSVQ